MEWPIGVANRSGKWRVKVKQRTLGPPTGSRGGDLHWEAADVDADADAGDE